jgi:hypothetical protein
MYCSTCGAVVPSRRAACSECGTRVRQPVDAGAYQPVLRTTEHGLRARAVRDCPRCSYQGEGIPYFSRGVHVAGLVGATVLTAAAMGAGGLVYYVVRRDHQVCPRCGYGWGKFGERSQVSGYAPVRAGMGPSSIARPDREGAKLAWSWILFVLAAIMVAVAVGELELVAALFGLVFAGGGYALRRAALSERTARRAALVSQLQTPVLKLAARCGGRLTVTTVAAELGWTMPRAEKILNSLDDGVRVSSEVTDEGVIVYEFREIINAPREAWRLHGDGRAGADEPE